MTWLNELTRSSRLEELCDTVRFAAGEQLRQQGHHYRELLLLISGSAEAQLRRGSSSHEIVVGPGSPIGEIGFLNGRPATGTVVARDDVQALAIDDETLHRLERDAPELAVPLLRMLGQIVVERLSFNTAVLAGADPERLEPVEVILCRSADQLRRAWSLRYETYCVELGRTSPYADHQARMIRDDLDDFGHTFIAMLRGDTVGTVRCNFAKEGPLGLLPDLYGMERSEHHPQRTMICTKLVVEKRYRKTAVSMHLVGTAARYALDAGMQECYVDSIPELVPLYQRLGFQPAAEEFYHYENGPSLPMRIDVVEDGSRLASRLPVC